MLKRWKHYSLATVIAMIHIIYFHETTFCVGFLSPDISALSSFHSILAFKR